MCRLFVVRAAAPVRVERAFQALKEQSREHKDGWGLVQYDSGQAVLQQSLDPAHACKTFDRLGSELATASMILHLRLASVGSVTERNAHPFVSGPWAFMHNGTVFQFARRQAEFEKLIAPEFRAQLKGETDSERLFALFCTYLKDQRDESIDSAAHALERVSKTAIEFFDIDVPDEKSRSSLNFVLTNGRQVVARRRGRTLFHSNDSGARFIASEPLWQADAWAEVPEGATVIIRDDLSLTVR